MWRLVIRNWWISPGRAFAIVLSVAIGVGILILDTSFYETARRMIQTEVVARWLGSAHLSIQPAGAHWGGLDAALAGPVAHLTHVAHVAVRLQRRMAALTKPESNDATGPNVVHVDAVGVDPDAEERFGRMPKPLGRPLRSGDRGEVLVETAVLREWELSLGKTLVVRNLHGGPPKRLTIVGSYELQRAADFQRPTIYLPLEDLQEIDVEPGRATAIDIMLDDTSPSAMRVAQEAVERFLAERGESLRCRVESSAAAQTLLSEADRITRLALTIGACIVMLTSFFIILTTMSMSLFARRTQMGTLRCVGATRLQLSILVWMEIAAPTVLGILFGCLLAFGVLAKLPDWLGEDHIAFSVSRWGVQLAIVSALITAMLSGVILCVQINGVSPLAALAPLARPARSWLALLSGAIGMTLIAGHEVLIRTVNPDTVFTSTFVFVGGGSLYLGYIALAPLFVVWLGPVTARVVGAALGLHPRIAAESFARTPWRCTGACWMLTVGVGLIVYHAVEVAAIRAIWNFPGRLPEAFVWSPRPISGESLDEIRGWPVVKRLTAVADLDCTLETHGAATPTEPRSLIDRFLAKLTRPVFIASDPNALLDMIKVVFVEGTADKARAKLAGGGHVLVPTQTARQHRLRLGDRITVHVRDQSAEFIIAGVIQSPALDLAVTAFQASSYLQFAAAAALLGTREDMKQKFGLEVASMLMIDLHLPESVPHPDFLKDVPPDHDSDAVIAHAVLEYAERLPEERELFEEIAPALRAWKTAPEDTPRPTGLETELQRFGSALKALPYYWKRQTPVQNWHRFRERLVLHRIALQLDRPDAMLGSMLRLKNEVDSAIRRATIVLTWIPSILLIAATIGLANLMMVSVQIRAREFAILRAIGALKSQVLCLVLAEAAVMGLFGSVMGIALGMHTAFTDHRLSAIVLGFRPEYIVPVLPIALAVLLTLVICQLAGLPSARYAARENISQAVQTA